MDSTLWRYRHPVHSFHTILTNCLIQSVHGATRKNLLKIKGFSEVKVEKIKDAIQKCMVCHPPVQEP